MFAAKLSGNCGLGRQTISGFKQIGSGSIPQIMFLSRSCSVPRFMTDAKSILHYSTIFAKNPKLFCSISCNPFTHNRSSLFVSKTPNLHIKQRNYAEQKNEADQNEQPSSFFHNIEQVEPDIDEREQIKKLIAEFENEMYKKRTINLGFARVEYIVLIGLIILLCYIYFVYNQKKLNRMVEEQLEADSQMIDAFEAANNDVTPTNNTTQNNDVSQKPILDLVKVGEGNEQVWSNAPRDQGMTRFGVAMQIVAAFGFPFYYSTILGTRKISKYLNKNPEAAVAFTPRVTSLIVAGRASKAGLAGLLTSIVTTSLLYILPSGEGKLDDAYSCIPISYYYTMWMIVGRGVQEIPMLNELKKEDQVALFLFNKEKFKSIKERFDREWNATVANYVTTFTMLSCASLMRVPNLFVPYLLSYGFAQAVSTPGKDTLKVDMQYREYKMDDITFKYVDNVQAEYIPVKW